MGAYNKNKISFSGVVFVCSVLFSVSANPHGHLYRMVKSLKYGGGGGVGPTAIDDQQIQTYNGGASYAGSQSYAQSNAASYAGANTGGLTIGAVVPFGLGFTMGASGAQSGALAGAAANSGAYAGNQGVAYSQGSPYNNPSGCGSCGQGAIGGNGALAGSAAFGGVGQNDQPAHIYDNTPSSGNINVGVGINKQNNQNSPSNYGRPGNVSPNSGTAGSFGFASAGAAADASSGFNSNQGITGTNTDQQKTEGSVVITGVQGFPMYASGGAIDASGNFPTYDSQYDTGFQTIVGQTNQPGRPVDNTGTVITVMKPDLKYPQTSYGYVPEGQPNMFIDGAVYKKDQKVVNKVPTGNIYGDGQISSYDTSMYGNINSGKTIPTYGMTVVVATEKKPVHGMTFYGSDNQAGAGANAQAGAGVIIGSVGSSPHHPNKVNTQTTVIHKGNGGTDTGKYTGTFGGGPGVLGDQRPPGYAITNGIAVDVSHSQGNANAGAGSFVGIQSSGPHSGHNGGSDTGKYTGSFGGGPGILGDQKPAGYAITGGVSIDSSKGSSFSHGHATAGTVAVAGNQAGSNHHAGGNTGKYSGTFGGGPGVLGDQKPAGYAITGAVNGGSVSSDKSQNHIATSAVNYQGDFGGAPGIITATGPASNVGTHAGSSATANAGAIAGVGVIHGSNPNHQGSLGHDINVHSGHVAQGAHANQGGAYNSGAANSGAYGNSGSFGVSIQKQGSLLGGLVGGMLNGIKNAAAAGSQALASSHSGSVGLGISSSYSAAGASSGSSAGCCG